MHQSLNASTPRNHGGLKAVEPRLSKGTIFDIKRYAIHDGPGIRTTLFFKGCPLRCTWCHNPEGMESRFEIMFRRNKCERECTACISVCPQGAISKPYDFITINNDKCEVCGRCADVCVYEALEIAGREVSTFEVVEQIEKDRIFFDESGGGVTFSGGEPLMQSEFLCALLREFTKKNIHTTLDTCGHASFEILERISGKVDLFLYDLKIVDDEKHKTYCGVSNSIILENLKRLSENRRQIIIRMPLVGGINDDDKNIQESAQFLLSLKTIKQINLLPYHRGGVEKYKRLRERDRCTDFRPPSPERTAEIGKTFKRFGFSVKIGG